MAAGDSVTSCCTSKTRRSSGVCTIAGGGCSGNASSASCSNVVSSCGTTRAEVLMCQAAFACSGNAAATVCAGCSGQVSASQTITVSEPDNYWQQLGAENYSDFAPAFGQLGNAYSKPISGSSTNFSNSLVTRVQSGTVYSLPVLLWYRIPLHKTFPYDTNTNAKYTGSNISDTLALNPTYNYTSSYFVETVDHDTTSSLDYGYFFEATDQVSSNGLAYTTKTTNANKAPLWPTNYADFDSSGNVTFKFKGFKYIGVPDSDVTDNIEWYLYWCSTNTASSVTTNNIEQKCTLVTTAEGTWNIDNPEPTISSMYASAFVAFSYYLSYVFFVRVVIKNYLGQGDVVLWQLNPTMRTF